MAEVQVTRWREIPSLVVAREGDEVVKVPLAPRLQEAIDEAAMRVSAIDANDYLEGWIRDPWTVVAGSATNAAASVAAELDAQWSEQAIADLLESLGPPS
jgi:hypothetical protein